MRAFFGAHKQTRNGDGNCKARTLASGLYCGLYCSSLYNSVYNGAQTQQHCIQPSPSVCVLKSTRHAACQNINQAGVLVLGQAMPRAVPEDHVDREALQEFGRTKQCVLLDAQELRMMLIL